jgi:hypothetical protein
VTNSNNNNDPAYLAALSADFMTAMLSNPNVEPGQPGLADHALAHAVALNKSLGEYFDQGCIGH